MRTRFAVLTLAFWVAAASAAQQTTRVSVASDGTEGNAASWRPALSSDCRFVAFKSSATNLVAVDTNGVHDVFVHDTVLSETTRVSIASNGSQGNDSSGGHRGPGLSADGQIVAFRSLSTNLVEPDINGTWDVFVHDRKTDETTRVSQSSNGIQGNDFSSRPSLSADGQLVAFWSVASNLVPLDSNLTSDTFVHDRSTRVTTRVSVASNGDQGNDGSGEEEISANGRFVTFSSYASNLVPFDTNGEADIFVHDRLTGQTTRVNLASDGSQAMGARSYAPHISDHGRFVSFATSASNLIPGDTNNVDDVFVHDRQSGMTFRVSVAGDGAEGNDESNHSRSSADGQVVVFMSLATNLVSNDLNAERDIFARDQVRGVTIRVSVSSSGDEANGPSVAPVLCGDGRTFAFSSGASNLVPGDSNRDSDIFVRILPTFTDGFESGDTSAWSSTRQ